MDKRDKLYENVMDGLDAVLSETIDAYEKQFVSVIGMSYVKSIVYVFIREEHRAWELPGGAVEVGETVLAAAAREFREETGLSLQEVREVLTIRNQSHTSGELDSRVAVVVGLVQGEATARVVDDEISVCRFFDSVPENTTLDRGYLNDVISVALYRYSLLQNSAMWNEAGSAYERMTRISEEEVHYGPLLPGESELRLMPLLTGMDVLELGCGAGHNLAALKRAGIRRGVGIDFCVDQIMRAEQRREDGLQFILDDFTRSPVLSVPEQFDLILSVFAFSFVPDLYSMILSISHSLKKGGCVILSTDHPSRNLSASDQGRRQNRGRERVRYWTIPEQEAVPYLHFLHSREDFMAAFAQAGLSVETVLEPSPLPFERIHEAPYYSLYYENRYEELRTHPYTILFKATKGF